ncbi:hypothetical protein E3E12_03955 [Formicincola oecophyllae]|uniref:ATP synthase subunit b n=1 Tax=Formicincola oecophyllae TaxID=2558361 RepID=A0A4Y6UAS8_9PROT|nr:hypothetical protein [Formicincola oecophyllae]QDH13491.1 hypothetical protein E3E12_03955 [Formicincola oecophyllae]
MRLSPRFVLSAATALALPGQAVAEGMPQFELGNPLIWGQVFWGAIVFFIFYLIAAYLILPRMAHILKSRDERIESDLKLAHKAKDDADAAHDDLKAAQEEAALKARSHIQQIREQALEDSRRQAAETNARLEGHIKDAEKNIDASRQAALSHVGQIASEAAAAMTKRLIGSANPEDIQKAVAQAQH